MAGNCHVFTFSPTGGTREVALLAAAHLGEGCREHDLTKVNFEGVVLGKDDVAIVAVPVFAGRVPALAAQRLARVMGGQARAVALAVYGNRHYDDALLELCDILVQQGFGVVAAGAFIARHSIVGDIGAGRPDENDKQQLAAFMDGVKKALEQTAGGQAPDVPGNRPYKEVPPSKRPILVSEQCTACGLCSRECPAAAIPQGDPKQTDLDFCISCMRCVHSCPAQARAYPAEVQAMMKEYLGQFAAPRQNEWYFAV